MNEDLIARASMTPRESVLYDLAMRGFITREQIVDIANKLALPLALPERDKEAVLTRRAKAEADVRKCMRILSDRELFMERRSELHNTLNFLAHEMSLGGDERLTAIHIAARRCLTIGVTEGDSRPFFWMYRRDILGVLRELDMAA